MSEEKREREEGREGEAEWEGRGVGENTEVIDPGQDIWSWSWSLVLSDLHRVIKPVCPA